MPRPMLSLIVLAPLALAACTTPRAQPTPSKAVLEARARQKTSGPAAGCPQLSAPMSVGFGFGESTLSDVNAPDLATLATAMTCRPELTATIVGQADGHGTTADQAKLAEDRAHAVVEDLEKRDVAGERLKTQVQGTAPAADADHLVVMAEGRRW